MQKSKGRRKYDREFKEEAVRLVTEGAKASNRGSPWSMDT